MLQKQLTMLVFNEQVSNMMIRDLEDIVYLVLILRKGD
ncbi:hypothetical protein Syn33_008 [Prochlorococcus phage Syn33]|uniref:Uncharacterized protein n=1 Tax=Prochlorococcus phage Syn33 TaxID=444878 RepID=E3SQP9_9CAUD|nr:hypothetical protein Syn33_008 [Prochlorococcus phage Syn33]ADO99771.1 hypothetical protein Syn33_008 [Prochlorococcus phage Syn33]